MKKNKLNIEEKEIHDKLDQFEVPYNPEHWDEMENRLNSAASGNAGLSSFKTASILVVLGAAAYFMLLDYTSNSKTQAELPLKQMQVKVDTPKHAQQDKSEAAELVEEVELVEAEEISTEEEIVMVLPDTIEDAEPDKEEIAEPEFNEKIVTTTEKKQIVDPLDLKIIAPQKTCLYSSIVFKVRNRAAFEKVSWKVNGKSFSGEHQFFEAGNYTITAQSIVNENVYKDTISLKFYPEDEFDFTYEQKEGLFNDFTVQFKTDAKEELYWLIQGKTINEQEPLYNFRKEGLYDVTAYFINENGCKIELYKPVAVMKDFHFYAADAFTPNDDGINDAFLPPILNEIDYHYDFIVYEVSGTEVFSTSQKGIGWNGKLNNNGEKLPVGSYIWKVIIKNEEGKERRFTGPIRIVELD